MRPPVVAGLTARAGASTLAAALHAVDAGRLDSGGVAAADVVVGRSGESQREATRLFPPTGPGAVLAAITEARAPHRPGPLPGFGVVVVLPHVPRWAGLADQREEAAALLARPVEDMPHPLREYAAALRHLVAGLLGSGQLQRPAPPRVIRPRAAPIVVPEPDDVDLEADVLRAPAGRAG